MGTPLAITQLALLSAGLGLFGAACLQDWAVRLVSNRIPAAIALAGLGLRMLDGSAVAGLLAAFAVFAMAAFCWRQGWLGGADVKLFGAGALLVPPQGVAGFVLLTCVAGGILALGYAALGRLVPPPAAGARPRNRLRRYVRLEQLRLRRRGPLPYATAITAGAICILLGA